MTEYSRRLFLASGAGLAAGSVAGTFLGANLAGASPADPLAVKKSHEFFGEHQNGIEVPNQAHVAFIGLELLPDTTKEACLRWMGIITEDASRLAQGLPTLGDPQPELVIGPAGLTFTVGFGPGLFEKLGLESKKPESLVNLPEFKMDRLRNEFSGGDVLIQIGSEDPIVLAHAVRQMVRTASSFALTRYIQKGFLGAKDTSLPTPRSRNLMGQVEGSGNPVIGSEDFRQTVWVTDGPDWVRGGTLMVLRRIAMDLDGWDKLGRSAKEGVIGRTLDTSAPLGQSDEAAPLNLADKSVATSIPIDAHIRRASSPISGTRIFRRSFNFVADLDQQSTQEVGLIWCAYQADISRQYLPIQRRLEQMDSLNTWTTPIGSAVFAIARGVRPGEIIAHELLS